MAKHTAPQAAGDFDTSHLVGDLKGKSVRSGAVTAMAQMTTFVLRLGSTAIMARLLTPAEFGLVALVYPVFGLAQILTDAGLSAATVQRANLTEAQVSALFWLNIILGLIATLAVAALCWPIAWFFDDPRLVLITVVSSSTLLLASLGLQHQALLQRHMRFADLAKQQVAACVLSSAAGILAAWAGLGYWSLVIVMVVDAMVRSLMAVLKSRFKPRLILRGSNVRPLLGFGTNLTVAGLLDFLRNDLTRLLIGWVWGAEALGFYNRGTGLLVQPMNQIMGPISSVAMPALAALQHDHDRYRRYVRRAMELVAMLWTPLVVLLLVGAEDVVMVMLGPQWGPVVPVFIALGPSAIISGLTIGIGWACLPTGQSKRLREWKTFSAVVMMVVTAVSLSWGIVGAAAAFSGVITVLFIPAIIYCCRGTPVRLVDIMVPTWRSMTASAIAGGVAWYVHQLGRADALALIEPLHLGATGRSAAMLAMLGVVFGVVYAGAFVVLPGGWAKVREVLSLVLHLRHRKSKTPPTPAAPAAT